MLGLSLAEMPQIDHRVCQGFERVVQLTDTLESKQQAFEFVFPGEKPLDGIEPLFENGDVEERLAAGLGSLCGARIRLDVGEHPTAVPNVIAAFLSRSRYSFAVKDAGIEKIASMKSQSRSGKYGFKTTVSLPSPECAIYSRPEAEARNS
jgi:hypothetical protein